MILKRAKDYYKNYKELLRERAKNKYREYSEEENNINREYGRNRYHNMSEEKKKRLKEYQKSYREAKKTSFIDVDMIIKANFNIAIAEIFFICSFINF